VEGRSETGADSVTGISTRTDAERLAYPPVPYRPGGADLEVDIGAGGLG
jgi:hypothetical protein